MAEITLDFLAEQQDRIISELGMMRDDMRVMAAIVQRLDGSMLGLINEVRAIHGQIGRIGLRLEKLEKA